jgi:VanZ family protein
MYCRVGGRPSRPGANCPSQEAFTARTTHLSAYVHKSLRAARIGSVFSGPSPICHTCATSLDLSRAHATQRYPPMLPQAESERAFFGCAAALTLAGVLVMSFLPSESVDPLRPMLGDSTDVAHVVAYALLAAATMLSLPRQAFVLRQGAAVVLATSLLGIAIELLQPVAGRTASSVDFAGNEIGIAVGMALFWAYREVGRARDGSSSRGDGEAPPAPRRCRDSHEKC